LKFTFLGTGTSQGVPVISCGCEVCQSTNPKDKRLRTSLMVEDKGKVIVVDSGPDFRQQLLRENVKRLDALIFTHGHKDHTAGMDDIRPFNYFQKKAMDIYATEQVQEVIQREFSYIFSGVDYPGLPQLKFHTIDLKPFHIEEIPVVPVEVLHYKLPVLGFRFGDFTYITDANFISDSEKKKIAGSKVLVLNALRREQHISHFTLDEAVAMAQELKAEKTYFTHISHQLGLQDEVNRELPEGIELAYDGLKIEL
jgi:phosphoribosyl 1,2-cyclic phosphate phosphodiesterase